MSCLISSLQHVLVRLPCFFCFHCIIFLILEHTEVPRTSRRLSLRRAEAEQHSFLSPSKQERLTNTSLFSANHSSPNTAKNTPFGTHQDNKTLTKDSPLRSKRDSWSNDFNWSPECVSKSYSMNQPLSSRMAQTSRHTYNIITGAPLLSLGIKSDQALTSLSYNQTQPAPTTNRVRFASRLEESNTHEGGENGTVSFSDGSRMPSGDTAQRHQPRAPHLNMRQSNNKNRTAMFNVSSQSSPMANTSLPGFYTSKRGSLSEVRGPMSYSRHSTMADGHDSESFIRGESGTRALLNAAG